MRKVTPPGSLELQETPLLGVRHAPHLHAAAAIIKALRKGDLWLVDRVYSGVPASDVGFSQKIRIGPMSGRSNVVSWLEQRGIEPNDDRADRIFEAAKRSDRLLEDPEIFALITEARKPA